MHEHHCVSEDLLNMLNYISVNGIYSDYLVLYYICVFFYDNEFEKHNSWTSYSPVMYTLITIYMPFILATNLT